MTQALTEEQEQRAVVCELLRFTIFGEPASKANSRRLVTIKGNPAFIKSKEALQYVRNLQAQAPKITQLLEGDLVFSATIFYSSHRKDLDPSLILDGLQGLVYKNDRQIREMHLYHGIDRLNPRAEIVVGRKK